MNNDAILKLAKTLLNRHGIKVTVQSAKTTSSIYVRLDRGVLGSLRIGDHSGSKRYSYKYEIGSHITSYVEIPASHLEHDYMRYHYRSTQVEKLVTQIRIDRSNMIAKYSQEQYEQFVRNSLR